MKFYTSIPAELKPYLEIELNQFRQAFAAEQLHIAWEHLERAHIIGAALP